MNGETRALERASTTNSAVTRISVPCACDGAQKRCSRMTHSRTAITSLAAAAILLVLGAPSAIAKPKPASGSQCSSSWVNNADAMRCFTQGEEESHAGVSHPHYVACLGAAIMCCKDNDHGGQDCVEEAGTRPSSTSDWVRAILAAQAMHLKTAERPAVKGGHLKTKSGGLGQR